MDPLAVYDPVLQSQFYGDGEHNSGVYNQSNINPYIYCYQNPVKYIDPNGKQTKGSQERYEGRGVPMIQPRPIGVPTNIPTAPPASSPSPGFWEALASVGTRLLPLAAVLIPGTLNAPTYNPKTPLVKTPTDDKKSKDAFIYRGGAFNDTNFTPRPGKDDGTGSKSGLSTFVLPELATQGKEGKVQKLSVKKLVSLGFELNFDGSHVGIRPPSQEKLEEWASTRPEVAKGGTPHILTEMVKSARVGEQRVQKK